MQIKARKNIYTKKTNYYVWMDTLQTKYIFWLDDFQAYAARTCRKGAQLISFRTANEKFGII